MLRAMKRLYHSGYIAGFLMNVSISDLESKCTLAHMYIHTRMYTCTLTHTHTFSHVLTHRVHIHVHLLGNTMSAKLPLNFLTLDLHTQFKVGHMQGL